MAFEQPLLVAAKFAVLLLGASVSALAYLSFRRTGERLMLFLAIAFALVALGSLLEGLLFEFFAVDLFTASTVETGFVLAGLLLLALLLRPRGVKA